MIPLKLIITDFMAHSSSELDFRQLDSIILIIGLIRGNPDDSNGAGKSAIFEAITYVLYEMTRINTEYRSEIPKDSLIRAGQDFMEVVFEFQIDDELYKVARSRDKKKSKTEVTLEQFNGKKWIPKGGKTIRETNAKIVELIGMDYEVFRNSLLFRQHEVSSFAKMSPQDRKDVVRKILQLDRYDVYKKQTKKQLDEIEGTLKEIDQFLSANIDVEEEHKETEKEAALIEQHLAIEEKKIKALQKQIDKLRREQTKLNKEALKREVLEKGIEQTNQHLNLTTSELEQSVLRKESCAEQLAQKQDQYESLYAEAEQLEQAHPKIATTKNKYNAYKLRVDRTETDYRKIQSKVFIVDQKLEEIENRISEVENQNEGDCPICTRPITAQHKKEVKKHLGAEHKSWSTRQDKGKVRLDEAIAKAQDAKAELKKIEDDIEEIKDAASKAKRLKARMGDVKEVALALKEAAKNSEGLTRQYEKRLDELQVEFEQQSEELAVLASFDPEQLDRANGEIREFNVDIQIANDSVRVLEVKKGSCRERARQQKEILERIKELKGKSKAALEEQQILKELIRAFGKNGIQALILENSAAEIEEISNDLLSRLTNSNLLIRIRTQKQNKDGTYKEVFDIIITDQYHTNPFELYSGGEAFRIAFAIRIALSTLLARRAGVKMSTIFYDEAFQDLDANGISGLIDAFHILSKDFRYQLVITHDSELKSKFASVVTVTKGVSGATVEY